jgi:hypothetical protein
VPKNVHTKKLYYLFFPVYSEGLTWHLNDGHQLEDLHLNDTDYTLSTTGFVITGDSEDKIIRAASLVLTIDDNLEAKMATLTQSGFTPKNSWGIALTSFMRGYDGDDITPEHLEERNKIHRYVSNYLIKI